MAAASRARTSSSRVAVVRIRCPVRDLSRCVGPQPNNIRGVRGVVGRSVMREYPRSARGRRAAPPARVDATTLATAIGVEPGGQQRVRAVGPHRVPAVELHHPDDAPGNIGTVSPLLSRNAAMAPRRSGEQRAVASGPVLSRSRLRADELLGRTAAEPLSGYLDSR